MRTLTLLAAALILGCGSKNAADTAPLPEIVAVLREVGEMLSAGNENGRGPRGLSDLAKVREVYPRAWKNIENGEVIVFWQTNMKGEGAIAAGTDTTNAKAIACEKKAPSEGGWVLFNDGTVKELKPDELAKAK